MSLSLYLQPFRVRLRPFPSEVPNESDAQRHKRIRAQYRQSDTKRYAQVRGIELLVNPVGVDPTIAHLGLILATDHGVGSEYARVVFGSFWKNKLNLESENEIVSVLRGIGIEEIVSLDGLKSRMAALHEELMSQEVFSVPTFLLRGERFIGRQHIPMIRNLYQL